MIPGDCPSDYYLVYFTTLHLPHFSGAWDSISGCLDHLLRYQEAYLFWSPYLYWDFFHALMLITQSLFTKGFEVILFGPSQNYYWRRDLLHDVDPIKFVAFGPGFGLGHFAVNIP